LKRLVSAEWTGLVEASVKAAEEREKSVAGLRPPWLDDIQGEPDKKKAPLGLKETL
jgi:hypothetical protein